MNIAVVNRSKTPASEVKAVVAAVQKQLSDHVRPAWHIDCAVTTKTTGADAAIYLQDQADIEGVLGYHAESVQGKPYGFVFTELSQQLGEPWSVTLSHEVLELAGNPFVSGYAIGKHPTEDRQVFYWQELCDAVQDQRYKIGSVWVSNFVLPRYFTPQAEVGFPNDYLNQKSNGRTLASFGVAPGGYVGYYDPEVGEDLTYMPRTDARARKRLEIKEAFCAQARRSVRISARRAGP